MVSLHRQQGFTLVEVITVMLVLVAIATITVESSKDFVFQNRYEVTKDRYEKIKKAIIGDTNQVINGQPNINGFVADMGRLPRNLHELLVQNYCDNDYRISDNTPNSTAINGATGATPEQWCTSKTPAGNWIKQSNNTNCSDAIQTNQVSCEAVGMVWTGWKGPYVETAQADYKANALPDGWGNAASTTDFTEQNYGWLFCLGQSPNINNSATCNSPTNVVANLFALSIQSKGKDSSIGGTADYDKDYPENITVAHPSIAHSDWTVDIRGLKILVNSFYNGSCSISNTCSNPALLDSNSCSGKNTVWDVPTSFCKVPIFTTELSCTANLFTWDSSNNFCKDTRYTTQAACEVNNHNWANHNAKANCEASGGQWTPAHKNIQLKINTVLSTDTPSITEDGRENLMSFNFANNAVPMGSVSVGVYYASDINLSYPSICTNTNNHVNFTQPNCLANSGIWKDDSTEQYCYELTQAIQCTGVIPPQLGGILKPEIKLTLYPNTTLPTISW